MELNELSIKLASFETEGVSFESFLIANEGEQDVFQVHQSHCLPVLPTHG